MFTNKVPLKQLFGASQRDSVDMDVGNTQTYFDKLLERQTVTCDYYSSPGSDVRSDGATSPIDLLFNEATKGDASNGKTLQVTTKVNHQSILTQKKKLRERDESHLLKALVSCMKECSAEVKQATAMLKENMEKGSEITEESLTTYLHKVQVEMEKHNLELIQLLEHRDHRKEEMNRIKQELKMAYAKNEELQNRIKDLQEENNSRLLDELQKSYFDNTEDIKDYVGRIFQRQQQDLQQQTSVSEARLREAIKQHSHNAIQQTIDSTDIVLQHVDEKKTTNDDNLRSVLNQELNNHRDEQIRFQRQVEHFIKENVQDLQRQQKEEIKSLFKQQHQQLERDKGQVWEELFQQQSKELNNMQAKQKKDLLEYIKKECADFNEIQMKEIETKVLQQWQHQKKDETLVQRHWQRKVTEELETQYHSEMEGFKTKKTQVHSMITEKKIEPPSSALSARKPSDSVMASREPPSSALSTRGPSSNALATRDPSSSVLSTRGVQTVTGKPNVRYTPFKRPHLPLSTPMTWSKVPHKFLEAKHVPLPAPNGTLFRSPVFENKKYTAKELFGSSTTGNSEQDNKSEMSAKNMLPPQQTTRPLGGRENTHKSDNNAQKMPAPAGWPMNSARNHQNQIFGLSKETPRSETSSQAPSLTSLSRTGFVRPISMVRATPAAAPRKQSVQPVEQSDEEEEEERQAVVEENLPKTKKGRAQSKKAGSKVRTYADTAAKEAEQHKDVQSSKKNATSRSKSNKRPVSPIDRSEIATYQRKQKIASNKKWEEAVTSQPKRFCQEPRRPAAQQQNNRNKRCKEQDAVSVASSSPSFNLQSMIFKNERTKQIKTNVFDFEADESSKNRLPPRRDIPMRRAKLAAGRYDIF